MSAFKPVEKKSTKYKSYRISQLYEDDTSKGDKSSDRGFASSETIAKVCNKHLI